MSLHTISRHRRWEILPLSREEDLSNVDTAGTRPDKFRSRLSDNRIPPFRDNTPNIGTEHGPTSCGLRCRPERKWPGAARYRRVTGTEWPPEAALPARVFEILRSPLEFLYIEAHIEGCLSWTPTPIPFFFIMLMYSNIAYFAHFHLHFCVRISDLGH